MNNSASTGNPQKETAAQNAQDGVVNVFDLSLLTGIDASQLTRFAKQGRLEYFGEYHGKRFYNFQKIINWVIGSDDDDEARVTIRKGMEEELLSSDCPYSIEMKRSAKGRAAEIKISWKVPTAV